MEQLVIYIHGRGGTPGEAEHYRDLFPHSDVTGMEYISQTPWEAKEEFPALFERLSGGYSSVILIANSIGAYLALNSISGRTITKALLISPVVDMERLIAAMMQQEGITEDELCSRGEITTGTGEKLSWEYLRYVRENPISWEVPTGILYGGNDFIVPMETVELFAERTGAVLTVMEDGEHWFHTPEQMAFLDEWVRRETAGL